MSLFSGIQGAGGAQVGGTQAYNENVLKAGGTAPVISTTASALDFMSCQYDRTDDTLACVLHKGVS